MRSISEQNADFPAEAPPDVWLRVTAGDQSLELQTLFGAFSVPLATIVRWGGLAGMVGGGLWLAVIFMLLVLPSLMQSDPATQFPMSAPWVIDTRLFIVPLLLFLAMVIGLCARQRLSAQSRLTDIGLALSIVGWVLTIVLIAWHGPRYYFSNSVGGWFGNWDEYAQWFFGSVQPGPIIGAIGLLLFGISSARRKTLPIWGVILLVGALFTMHITLNILSGMTVFLRPGCFDCSYGGLNFLLLFSVCFSLPALLFGIGWTWIGRTLWLEGSKA